MPLLFRLLHQKQNSSELFTIAPLTLFAFRQKVNCCKIIFHGTCSKIRLFIACNLFFGLKPISRNDLLDMKNLGFYLFIYFLTKPVKQVMTELRTRLKNKPLKLIFFLQYSNFMKTEYGDGQQYYSMQYCNWHPALNLQLAAIVHLGSKEDISEPSSLNYPIQLHVRCLDQRSNDKAQLSKIHMTLAMHPISNLIKDNRTVSYL